MRTIAVICLLITAAVAAAAGSDPVWRRAAPGYQWSFPRDHYQHPEYQTEWWYVTGQLVLLDDPDAEPLGFQQTFFRVGLTRDAAADSGSDWAARDLVMAHASLADPERGRHVFSEVLRRAVPLLGGFGAPGDSVLAWVRAPAGTDDDWSLTLTGDGFRLRSRDDRRGLRYDLVAVRERPLVLHGDGGYSAKTADGENGSLYVSATRLAIRGTVWRDGEPTRVAGRAWWDQEVCTNTLAPGQAGWDWLCLQLEDGRDLMLYRLRTADGETDFAHGTLVAADGTVSQLPADSWTWTPGETWTSPATGAPYPIAWRLRIPAEGIDLELRATMPDQENVSTRTNIFYWEGAMRATAPGGKSVLGRGFVELTGYGKGGRPPV